MLYRISRIYLMRQRQYEDVCGQCKKYLFIVDFVLDNQDWMLYLLTMIEMQYINPPSDGEMTMFHLVNDSYGDPGQKAITIDDVKTVLQMFKDEDPSLESRYVEISLGGTQIVELDRNDPSYREIVAEKEE